LPIDAEIGWNEFLNVPGESYVEDNINNAGGTVERPILIHNNFRMIGWCPACSGIAKLS
jgi:hypothetical protein